jgi:phage protein D
MDGSHYIPDFRLEMAGAPVPAELRASVSNVTLVSGLEGADRAEITLVNDSLRWLDNPLFALDTPMTLRLGYADTGLEQVFVGQVVGFGAAFPNGAGPTVTVTAQDARYRLAQGNKVRWFGIPIPSVGVFPLPDVATTPIVALENLLLPIIDPVGAALSILLGAAEAASSIADPGGAQKFIRKQANESDYDFLTKIAKENGWEMVIDHSGPLGGHLLHFFSPLDKLQADVNLAYGASLMEFTPRITNVGQIFSVSGYVWVPAIKMVFNIVLGFDWDRMALTLAIYPAGIALAPSTPSADLIDDPLTLATAPRKLVSELIPKLNKRLTATGGTIGDPAILAGRVLRITGVGVQFGGLWRVTEATHTIDSSGYRTHFELRKEIWFGSIPAPAQGAIPVRLSF